MTVGGIAFNPLVANQLITSAGVGVWTSMVPNSGFSSSSQMHFTSQSIGIEQVVANQVIVPSSRHPVIGSWDRPFFYLTLGQYPANYSPNSASVLSQGWSLDYASSNPSFLVGIADYAYTNAEFSSFSSDAGQSWMPFASFPTNYGTFPYVGGTIAASTQTNFVWATADGNQPFYTINGGASWSPVTLPGVSSWSSFDWQYSFNVRTVAADRVAPNTFYLYYAGQGLYTTANGGATWTQAFAGELASYDYYSAEMQSVPGEQGHLFFTGGPQTGFPNEPFLRSINGGVTWTNVPNVTQVYCFGFGAARSPSNYPAIYIVGWAY